MNDRFTWDNPGEYEGFPYIGRKTDLKDSDSAESQPVLRQKACVKTLELPRDIDEYQGILTEACEGKSRILYEDKQYDPEIRSWRVLISWAVFYYSEPPYLSKLRQARPRFGTGDNKEPDDEGTEDTGATGGAEGKSEHGTGVEAAFGSFAENGAKSG